jgi:hypothetical protein
MHTRQWFLVDPMDESLWSVGEMRYSVPDPFHCERAAPRSSHRDWKCLISKKRSQCWSSGNVTANATKKVMIKRVAHAYPNVCDYKFCVRPQQLINSVILAVDHFKGGICKCPNNVKTHLTELTRIPFGANSKALQRVNWSSPAFEMLYAKTFGN